MPPGVPAVIEDLPVWRGDPYAVRVVWKAAGTTTPIDVSASVWTFRVRGLDACTVDTSAAATGAILLILTDDQTRGLLPMARWELAEQGLWNRTLLQGRFVPEDDVA